MIVNLNRMTIAQEGIEIGIRGLCYLDMSLIGGLELVVNTQTLLQLGPQNIVIFPKK